MATIQPMSITELAEILSSLEEFETLELAQAAGFDAAGYGQVSLLSGGAASSSYSASLSALELAETVELAASEEVVKTAAVGLAETAGGGYKVVGLLSMDLGAVAAAAAPVTGVVLGAGIYESNPSFWTDLSIKLLPFCYPGTTRIPTWVEIGKDAITGNFIYKFLVDIGVIDTMKDFYDENIPEIEPPGAESFERDVIYTSGSMTLHQVLNMYTFATDEAKEAAYASVPNINPGALAWAPQDYLEPPGSGPYVVGGNLQVNSLGVIVGTTGPNTNIAISFRCGPSGITDTYYSPGDTASLNNWRASMGENPWNPDSAEYPEGTGPWAGEPAPADPPVWPDIPIPNPSHPDEPAPNVTPITPGPSVVPFPIQPTPTPENPPEQWPEEEPYPKVIPFPYEVPEEEPSPNVIPFPLPNEPPEKWPITPPGWPEEPDGPAEPYWTPDEPFPRSPEEWPDDVPWPDEPPEWWPEEYPWPETPEEWPEEVPWPDEPPESWPEGEPWPESPDEWPEEIPWPDEKPDDWPGEWPDAPEWPDSPSEWPEEVPWKTPYPDDWPEDEPWPVEWPPSIPYPIPFPNPYDPPEPEPEPGPEPEPEPDPDVDPWIQPTPYPEIDPDPDPDPPPPDLDPEIPQPKPTFIPPAIPPDPDKPFEPTKPDPDPDPDPDPPVDPPSPRPNIEPDPPIGISPIPTMPDPEEPYDSTHGLITVYHPTKAQLLAFANWLWVTYQDATIDKIWNNPFDGIISLFQIYCTPTDIGTKTIKSGFLDSGINSAYISRYTEINCGTLAIPEVYGNYFDYSPYSKCHIYLPFIGIQELNVDDVVGHTINVTYRIDEYNGSCIAIITSAKVSVVNGVTYRYSNAMYQFSGNCAVEVPLTGGSQAAIIAGLTTADAYQRAGQIAATASLVGGIASIISTNPIGNLTKGIGGYAEQTAYAEANYLQNMLGGKSTVQKSGSFGASHGALGIKTPFITVTRPRQVKVPNYNLLYGYPAHKMVTLNSCTGFVRCREVHVLSYTATSDEKDMIEAMLKSGVYVTE